MDSNAVLRSMSHDMDAMMRDSPNAHLRIDDGGWLGLSGEKGFADLNMAMVFRSGGPVLLQEYLREINDRELQAVLIVEADSPEVEQAAVDEGLMPAGQMPIMVWEGKPAPVGEARFKMRLGTERDLPVVLRLASEAFSMDEEKLRRVFSPSALSSALSRGLDIWIAEDTSGPVGLGMFVASDDHVGIYTMSTPAPHQRRGIGRAVLDAGMAHHLDRGATTFTLGATEAGFHLYEQTGFEVVGKPSIYVIGMSTQFSS